MYTNALNIHFYNEKRLEVMSDLRITYSPPRLCASARTIKEIFMILFISDFSLESAVPYFFQYLKNIPNTLGIDAQRLPGLPARKFTRERRPLYTFSE